ncbi:MAG: hypothetical protein J0H63_04580 [Rhizobiales bacterium]|nr:hypothetical protein [Hyphomicrobiales bacterium]
MIIRCRLPEAIGNSRQFHEEWTAFLIQLETDGGLFGWGENTFLPHAVSAHVRHRLLPALMGKDPTAVLPLFRAMERTVGYDRRGAAMMAISAADMAIWDLAGRALGVPVATLLGGAVRDRVTAYASGPFTSPVRTSRSPSTSTRAISCAPRSSSTSAFAASACSG